MKQIFFTLFVFLICAAGSYAATSDDYIQYASNTVYVIEKVKYYDEYGRPVPPPKRHVDRRHSAPAYTVTVKPAPPPPPPPSYTIKVKPAPPPPPRRGADYRPAPAPSYNIQVKPAPPPPPRR